MQNISYTAKLQKAFKDANNAYNMIGTGDSVLVALSGGADSSALLDVLCGFLGSSRVFALHVNHMIRGEEAERDEQFCRDFCRERGISLTVLHKDIPLLAKERRIGVEEAARDFRYAALTEAAKRLNLQKIAVAHNADDNLETVLFNLIRGSGERGLCGIPPVRDNIIRPLLFAAKSDIVGYCRENGIGFVTDSTNTDTDYTRNFIRNEIAPLIKRINPHAAHAVTRSSRALRSDCEYIDGIANSIADDISTEALASLPDAILNRYIAKKYKTAATGMQIENVHITNISALIREHKRGEEKHLSLPGKTMAVVANTFEILPESRFFSDKTKKIDADFTLPLSKGANYLPAGDAVFILKDKKDINQEKNIYKLSIHTLVNSAKIIGVPYIRYRREGDAIRINGMKKSVKKLLCERKIPKEERAALPFICDDEGTLLIPGVCARDGILKKDDASDTLHFIYMK